jgi:hypothetical protein
MISFGLAVQLCASATTIASSWAYGNKKTAGPFIGLLSQVPWWTLMIYQGLWGLLPVNFVLTCIHIRNLIKWKKEAALGARD